LAEGIRPETIIKTGSPIKEILNFYADEIKNSEVLKHLDLNKKGYFIVSAHREENVDSKENFINLLDSLNAIAERYNFPVIVSTHPRTRIKLEQLNKKDINLNIQFLKPLGFFDYNHLQKNVFCIVSDSGTITEESSILNFPAITIRQAHEQSEGMGEGVLIMSGLKKERVLQAIDIVVSQFANKKSHQGLFTITMSITSQSKLFDVLSAILIILTEQFRINRLNEKNKNNYLRKFSIWWSSGKLFKKFFIRTFKKV
jgi:UDP-N-acetylglucosamine 2-epimerase